MSEKIIATKPVGLHQDIFCDMFPLVSEGLHSSLLPVEQHGLQLRSKELQMFKEQLEQHENTAIFGVRSERTKSLLGFAQVGSAPRSLEIFDWAVINGDGPGREQLHTDVTSLLLGSVCLTAAQLQKGVELDQPAVCATHPESERAQLLELGFFVIGRQGEQHDGSLVRYGKGITACNKKLVSAAKQRPSAVLL